MSDVKPDTQGTRAPDEFLKELLTGKYEIDPSLITDEALLEKDLGMDSLDINEISQSIEEQYRIEIWNSIYDQKTYGALQKYIQYELELWADSTTAGRLKKILLLGFGIINFDKCVPETRLKEDLGFNQRDITNLIKFLEEEFNTDIPDEVSEEFETYGDVLDCLEKIIAQL